MDFDAIVVGGGHAGIEAGLALARLGHPTLLVTQNLDQIGKLSCNPAVGGLAKGNMVREIDALGGEMGRLIDATMIQFRVLNRSRGPAVQAPRAQADKLAYQVAAKQVLEDQPNLHLFQDTVTELTPIRRASAVTHRRSRPSGVKRFTARTRGRHHRYLPQRPIYIGEYTASAGRIAEPAATGLDRSLREIGFRVGRLKTGTPARVHRDSLDFDRMTEQFGDEEILPFSFGHERVDRPMLSCWITFTNERTHAVIRENMHRSPLYSGRIEGTGPRYCPSIEDKVVKFPDRDRHQIFVEPEGRGNEGDVPERDLELAAGGRAGGVPEDDPGPRARARYAPRVRGRVRLRRPVAALPHARVQDGERALRRRSDERLERLRGGGGAGARGRDQRRAEPRGRSSARAQPGGGVHRRAHRRPGHARDEGAVPDVHLARRAPDLAASRLERRTALRTRRYAVGLQSDEAHERFLAKRAGIDAVKELLRARPLRESEAGGDERLARHAGKRFYQVLKDPEVTIPDLVSIEPAIADDRPTEWLRQVELDVKYEGYVARQERQIARFEKLEAMQIPCDFDYDAVGGISNEAREKLKEILPLSLGQASRVPGVRNADVAVLMVALERRQEPVVPAVGPEPDRARAE